MAPLAREARGLSGTVLALFLLLLAPSATATPWLQHGFEPGRTSATPDEGPALPEVAWRVELPGSRAPWSDPLLTDDHVYVLTADLGIPGKDTNALWRIAIETGEPEEVVGFDAPASTFLLDETTAYVTEAMGIAAYRLVDGALLWREPYPVPASIPSQYECRTPLLRGTILVVGCIADATTAEEAEVGQGEPELLFGGPHQGAAFVARLDLARCAETCPPTWVWWYKASNEVINPDDATAEPLDAAGGFPPVAIELSLHLETVFVALLHLGDADTFVTAGIEQRASGTIGTAGSFWALDLSVGRNTCGRGLGGGQSGDDAIRTAGGDPTRFLDRWTSTGTPVISSGDRIFWREYEIEARDPVEGCGNAMWTTLVDSAEPAVRAGQLSLGAFGLYVTDDQGLHQLDPDLGRIEWVLAAPAAHTWGLTPVVSARDLGYGRTVHDRSFAEPTIRTAIHAIDPGEGRILWSQDLTEEPVSYSLGAVGPTATFSVSSGRLAAALLNGEVVLFGPIRGSVRTELVLPRDPPPLGSPFTVDLSASAPGRFGAPTTFRADWGDGSEDDWQAEPVLTHTYRRPGPTTARFYARNDAGQVGVAEVVLDVGGEPSTFLETAFARENQDLTFGILGIALAVTGGAIGVTRARTRRGRLHRELTAVEAAARDAGGDLVRLRHALEERRAHARGLLLDGRLDDSQFGVLEARIDELLRESRRHALDERLAYLPHGMVQMLHEMLSDGRISRWERDHFRQALEAAPHLNAEQREAARALIDAWFGEDEGVVG